MFDPFDSPSSDFFGRTAFTDSLLRDSEMASEMVNRGVQNAGYIEAAKRADKYAREAQKRAARLSRPSTGSQIGGILGSVVSAIF